MEPHCEAHLDGDWDFAQQFLVQILNEHEQASMNPVGVDESSLYSPHASNTTLQYNCENSGNSSVIIPTSNNESFGHFMPDHVLVSEDMNSLPMDVNMIHPEKICAVFHQEAIDEYVSVNAGQELQLKRKFDVRDPVVTRPFRNAKKPRISAYSPTCKKNNDAQSYNSQEENVSSQELNWGATTSDSKGSAALNSNGKTRASRGSATDPQSLYARRRREKINERIRILQSLVPNGTKVDISTMLEEAVHYVKFLQLQIRLLSSDDLWMYAPIVYSGMDYGFNQNISPS